jgi:hypothetical protein
MGEGLGGSITLLTDTGSASAEVRSCLGFRPSSAADSLRVALPFVLLRGTETAAAVGARLWGGVLCLVGTGDWLLYPFSAFGRRTVHLLSRFRRLAACVTLGVRTGEPKRAAVMV